MRRREATTAGDGVKGDLAAGAEADVGADAEADAEAAAEAVGAANGTDHDEAEAADAADVGLAPGAVEPNDDDDDDDDE